MTEFEGKVAVVTGAAGNLGVALSAALARVGSRLALLDRDEGALAHARSDLPQGGDIGIFATDLTDASRVNATIAAVHEQFGRIDSLFNVAGGFTMGPAVTDTDDATWDFMMDLNARSVFNMCRAVLPLMQRAAANGGSGRIINVSARAALAGKGNMGPYCASKAAVITLTETLAEENKHLGINVNCILPGTVDTPQNREAMPDQDHGTWVPPAALADVMLFLASDAARCVTGAAVPVYGRS